MHTTLKPAGTLQLIQAVKHINQFLFPTPITNRVNHAPIFYMDFLSPDNACGQSLLILVARGSAILAEL